MEDKCTFWVGVCAVVVILYCLVSYYRNRRKRKMLEKWSLLSQDKLILHGVFGENSTIPSTSPYVIKLETFLRLTKIPYEIDKTDPFGPKGKLPWISYNGNHMGDTQMIIEFLKKKFETKIGNSYSEEQKAIGTLVRITLEEHVYWGGVLWGFVGEGKEKFMKAFFEGKLSLPKKLLFNYIIAPHMKKMAWSQGLGRHSKEEVRSLMFKDIRAISKILGNKKYIMGKDISTEDCAVFALLSVDFFMGNSRYQELFDGECSNLKQYILRIKSLVWPEWKSAIII